MSESTAPAGFVPRGKDLVELKQVAHEVRSLERERRIARLLSVAGGWIVAGFMTTVAGGCLAVMYTRPVPQDRLLISVLHDDGTYDAPQVKDDLPKSRREMLFRYTVTQYVRARESYSWEGVQNNYNLVSAISSPDERTRYQRIMLNKHDPENPVLLYGDGLDAAIADVIAIQIKPVQDSPNSVDAVFKVKIVSPKMPDRTIQKTARLAWMAAEDRIPAKVQQEQDPLGIAFTHYTSIVDLVAMR